MRNQERYDRLISLVLFHFCFPLFVRPMMNKYGVVKYETSSKVYPIPFPLLPPFQQKFFIFETQVFPELNIEVERFFD